MMTTHFRGHKVYFDNKINQWRYVDNNEIADYERPCVRCGKMPDKDGYDACLGHIPNATSACCGHGVSELILKIKK